MIGGRSSRTFKSEVIDSRLTDCLVWAVDGKRGDSTEMRRVEVFKAHVPVPKVSQTE